MFEVVLGLGLICVILLQGFSLWKMHSLDSDSGDIESLLGIIEGKLQLSLEKIDQSIDSFQPPTVAEHVAGMASMWMQQRMMDKMGQMPQHLNEPADAPTEAWHADVPLQSAEVEQ